MTLSKSQFGQLHSEMMSSPGVEGGFTIHARTGERPSEGFMVSYPDTERLTSPASATKPRDIVNFARQNKADLGRPDVYLGGWKPESDEFTTLDKSQVVKPSASVSAGYGPGVASADARTSALDLGLARNQFAVYDLKQGRSYPTGTDRA